MEKESYKYELTERTVDIEDCGKVRLYGIRINEINYANECTAVKEVEDVFDDYSEAIAVLRLIESERLEPVHLHDFLCDYFDTDSFGRKRMYGIV